MADLDAKMTFDTFVVGPANRLAWAAARRAAESPGQSYNPLFIYSASGLGKTHILAAISHQGAGSDVKRNIRYQAVERYLEELAEALETGRQDELRERYRTLDVLLLDDVQFLEDQPQAQEMLLSTLDALTGSGGQIVLASDRAPAEINGLDSRLLSRFSGGLIVDIGAPEYETRVAIVRRKAEEQGQALGEGVAEAVAKVPVKNVRELGGALNRILAVQELEERPVTAGEISRLLGLTPEEPRSDDFGDFLDEIAGELSTAVTTHDEPWRKTVREAIEAAEREGFVARRLRALLDLDAAPPDPEERVARFKADLSRLREIEAELDRLGNPWPDAAQKLLRDPERMSEVEAFLTSVQERQRPFPGLGPGLSLSDLDGRVPQLALKAAQQLVNEEKPKYNPLFLWGVRPEAGRALVGATARSYRALQPQAKVAVSAVSDFAEDFIRALSAGVAGAWRERWWTVDLLLVHGIQALADTERAQDEFFHLFEALKRRGSRILLTADRAPTSLEGIDERLRSRFEGGLVLELTTESLPPAAADLTMQAPSSPPAGGAWQEHVDLPTEAETFIGPEAEGKASQAESPALASPGPPSASSPRSRPTLVDAEDKGPLPSWRPTREQVVWHWPRLEDRIIEELE